MSDYDLLADLREWAESYDAVEIGADGVLYNAINRIELLEATLKGIFEEADGDFPDIGDIRFMSRAALEGKKDE